MLAKVMERFFAPRTAVSDPALPTIDGDAVGEQRAASPARTIPPLSGHLSCHPRDCSLYKSRCICQVPDFALLASSPREDDKKGIKKTLSLFGLKKKDKKGDKDDPPVSELPGASPSSPRSQIESILLSPRSGMASSAIYTLTFPFFSASRPQQFLMTLKVKVKRLRITGFGIQPQDSVVFLWEGELLDGPARSLFVTLISFPDESRGTPAKNKSKKKEEKKSTASTLHILYST